MLALSVGRVLGPFGSVRGVLAAGFGGLGLSLFSVVLDHFPFIGRAGPGVTSVATFDAGGAAQSVAATQDGQVLSRVAGALVWVTLAATVSLVAGVELIEYLDYGADALPVATTAVVEAGVIA